jgi:hypothetical protein
MGYGSGLAPAANDGDPRAMGLELGLGREGTSSAHAGEAPHATIDLP